jgi:uncharacterized protein (TIGR02266 family)
VSLDVEFVSAEGRRSERATTLGGGGLFVRTADPLPEDALLRVRFRLPGSLAVHALAARVAWVLEPSTAGPQVAGMGLAFNDAQEIEALARDLEALDHRDDEAPAC